MKQKILDRILSGILIAYVINFIICAAISVFLVKDGHFYYLRPGMAEQFGGEIPAMILQALLLTVFGAIFGAAGLAYEKEDWGISKQTIVHFAILVLTFLIVGGILRWYPLSIVSIVGGVLTFSLIYFLIWIGLYTKIRKDIERVNRKISE